MRWFVETVPLFLPVLVLSVIVAVVSARGIARAAHILPMVAFLLVVSVGLVVAATLTPLETALADGVASSGTCDMSRVGWAPLSTYLRPTGAALNVVLFVPLGLALGLLPRGGRWTMAAVVAGFLSPLAVEALQLLLPALGRGCQAADVVDNVTGVVLGVAAGRVLGGLVGVVAEDGTGPA
jgi:glycopeptide antibiotics resistance protein